MIDAFSGGSSPLISQTFNLGDPPLASSQVKRAVHVSTTVATRRTTPMNTRTPTMIKRLSCFDFM
ncbi:hypothetical protein DSECCO2_618050 [anaerobic digester metagenome]